MTSSATREMLSKAILMARSETYGFFDDDDLLQSISLLDMLRESDEKVGLDILEKCTGTKRVMLAKMSLTEKAQHLDYALRCGATTSKEIFELLPFERYFEKAQDLRLIWQLISEYCYSIDGGDDDHRKNNFVIYLVTAILENGALGETAYLDLFQIVGPRIFVSDKLSEDERTAQLLRMMMRSEPFLKGTRTEEGSSVDNHQPKPYRAKHLIKDFTLPRIVEIAGIEPLHKFLQQFAKETKLVKSPDSEPDDENTPTHLPPPGHQSQKRPVVPGPPPLPHHNQSPSGAPEVTIEVDTEPEPDTSSGNSH